MQLKRGNKKASIQHEVYFMIFQLFLVILIFGVLIYFVVQSASGLTFEKYYYAKDLSMIASTVSSAPGDVYYYRYTANKLNLFDVDSNKHGEIKLSIAGDEADNYPLSWYYFYDPEITLSGSEISEKGIINFKKEEMEFKVGEWDSPINEDE